MITLSPKLYYSVLPWCKNMPFLCLVAVFNCSFSSLPTERYLVWTVLLCRFQGNEPHAVHWLRPTGTRESVRYLADYAEYDCRSYLLCCFHWPRNSSDSVPGLLQAAISRKGKETSPFLVIKLSVFSFFQCKVPRYSDIYTHQHLANTVFYKAVTKKKIHISNMKPHLLAKTFSETDNLIKEIRYISKNLKTTLKSPPVDLNPEGFLRNMIFFLYISS